jgi:broad specificity phosphatase PhoE
MALAADDIARAEPNGPVLVVSHGLALATLYCQARGIPLSEVYSHIADNTGAKVIEWPRN